MVTNRGLGPTAVRLEAPAPTRRTVPWPWLGGLAAITFALTRGVAIDRGDESWFLWVGHRMASGDVLYRDVYSVTTPLAHWVTMVALRITGTQLLTVRALSVACFVASAEAARRLVARTGVGAFGQCLLIGALFATASPVANFVAFYSGLAVALGMAAWVVAADGERRSPGRQWLAGGLVGASFLSKPNVGGLVLLAVLVVVVARVPVPEPGVRRRECARVVGCFALVVAAGFLIVAATGGARGFVDDVVLNKGAYLRLRVSYLGQVTNAVRTLFGRGNLSALARLRDLLAFVPIVAAVVVLALVRARGLRRAAAGPLAFVVAGLLTLVPRPTTTHIAAAVPFVLTGVVLAWRGVGARGVAAPWVRWVAAAAVVVVVAVVAVPAATTAVRGGATLPRFAGIPLRRARTRTLGHDLARLRTETGGSVFIVSPNAGFAYLAGRLDDPTPFDVPERSDFGPHDEQTAIAAVRAHPPKFVCLRRGAGRRSGAHQGLRPVRLEQYLLEHSSFVADVGVCRLYRFGPPG